MLITRHVRESSSPSVAFTLLDPITDTSGWTDIIKIGNKPPLKCVLLLSFILSQSQLRDLVNILNDRMAVLFCNILTKFTLVPKPTVKNLDLCMAEIVILCLWLQLRKHSLAWKCSRYMCALAIWVHYLHVTWWFAFCMLIKDTLKTQSFISNIVILPFTSLSRTATFLCSKNVHPESWLQTFSVSKFKPFYTFCTVYLQNYVT